MKNATLYTTDCPKCRLLKKKLDQKKVKYNEVTDVQEMISKGFKSVPVLEVDGEDFSYEEAVAYLDKV